ncbi:MAG: prolipoprotein diacylglyceryl transferase [Methylococcales symbiont of Iophon sp. n. MRB-2018]|nr:MAG: prolipoprotein diacylglyceryl transferase [Methylococcales symbiont of Iophon sp. n. MRB-2018]KAF3979801.1 MAG: prolipoprotein diacylglyceryl transferase [Methylococcales symbiont of Iophon sp. n. MRB-2018]
MDFVVWDIDPLFISFGFLKIRWYGLMFALAFISSYLLMNWMYKREGKNSEEIDDLLWYVAIGTIIGARLGHCLFYEPAYYLSNPLKILAFWEGGLASHGGILGIVFALYFYQRRVSQSYAWFLDRVAVVCALGGTFIRIGNFFNSEIVGKPTTVPWAVIFKRIDGLPRHPVQLYESISYFFIFILLLILYITVKDKIRSGVIFATSLVAVFSARFFLEFVKTQQSGYNHDSWMSTGQWLSIPFFLAGLCYILFSFRSKAG